MVDLAQRSEPYEIALPYGLTVAVKPLTTSGMAAVQAAARRAVEAIERQARERVEAGLALDGLPDLTPLTDISRQHTPKSPRRPCRALARVAASERPPGLP